MHSARAEKSASVRHVAGSIASGRIICRKAQATALAAGLEATARLTDDERATLAALLRKIYT